MLSPLDKPVEGEGTINPIPILPSLPPLLEKEDLLSALSSIKVNKFNFEGNHIFSSEELNKLIQNYQGREITAEELQEAKNKITQYYIDKGFINSGAIIPDQSVSNGEIKIKIIEGKLVRVEVTGEERLRKAYVRKRLEDSAGDALNITRLQEKLQLLQQDPLIKHLRAELGPGVDLGEGILRIDIKEGRAYKLQFNFNNHRAPSIGSYRGELEAWHQNLTGWGDTLYARYGLTEGLKDYGIRYSIPLNHLDTTLSLSMDASDSDVIEYPFNQLDVESEAKTYWVSLSHPLWKKPNGFFELMLRLEKRSSKTFLLGRPFSFSPGVRHGESDLSIVRFSQYWLDRDRVHVYAARSIFSLGLDMWNSTINSDGTPDSKYFSWLGQVQVVRLLDFLPIKWLKDSQILFRTDLQLANDGLLPLEKFSIGGALTVRGYRENQLTRDNGLASSLEWQIPLKFLQIPIPGLSKEPNDGIVNLVPFFDYGRSWNEYGDTPDPKNIYSAGLGLIWNPSSNFQTKLYWGHAFRKIEDQDNEENLQDKGIHFDIKITY
jgi:hemolysin activation/secretion protein